MVVRLVPSFAVGDVIVTGGVDEFGESSHSQLVTVNSSHRKAVKS